MANEQTIRDQATEWALQLHESGHSNFPVEQWKEWMTEHPKHQEAFRKAMKIWGLSEHLEADLGLGETAATKDSSSELSDEGQQPHWYKLVAASLIVFMTTGFWLLNKQDSGEISPAFTSEYQTAKGMHQSIELPDGSLIELGADSEVEIEYSGQFRDVHLLSGEGYFQVAKDTERPFRVYSDSSMAQALGTAFNVHRSLEKTTVTVTEGIVQFNALTDKVPSKESDTGTEALKDNYSRLIIGETASISTSGNISPTIQTDPEREIAWRFGQLVFIDEDLRSVTGDLNRYSDLEIQIESDEVADLRFTGTVLQDGIENWISALPKAFDVEVSYQGKKILITSI